MSHIFVSPENVQGESFSLDPKESHHVARVLRKKIGDVVTLFDGVGTRYQAQVTLVDPVVRGRIMERSVDSKKMSVTLLQGLPRGSKFDFVIEKATELGVDAILPFVSEKNPLKGTDKSDRWQRLAEAASKQCGRATIPVISAVVDLKSLSDRLENTASLWLNVASDAESIRVVLSRFREESPRKINVIVGPESGFSDSESAWIAARKCWPVSLGALTLRTETAGLVALSLLNYELA